VSTTSGLSKRLLFMNRVIMSEGVSTLHWYLQGTAKRVMQSAQTETVARRRRARTNASAV
jgi:hypothetical protein